MRRDFQNRNNPIWGFWGGGSLLSKNKNASAVHYVISACLRDSSIPGSKEVWPSFSDENSRLRKAEEPVQGELRSWLPWAHFPWDDTLYPSRSVSSLSPCIKILGCKWQKLTSPSLSKGVGGLFLFVYFIKLQDELDGVGFQDVQNRTWTAAVYLWLLHSFSLPFVSVFHCWLHFFLTADGLPLHWRWCHGQCQSVDVFTAYGLRK